LAVKLVIGASGFLGSHVARQLVHRGDRMRVLLRRTSSTAALDDLDIDRRYGDVFDDSALRDAMEGRDDVYYRSTGSRQGRTRTRVATGADPRLDPPGRGVLSDAVGLRRSRAVAA
jgi:uncharacterized protein YbjT (DUF2867 family)